MLNHPVTLRAPPRLEKAGRKKAHPLLPEEGWHAQRDGVVGACRSRGGVEGDGVVGVCPRRGWRRK
jgi:hypothetical protein